MRKFGRSMVSLSASLLLVSLASGCASIRDHRGYTADPALVDSVQVGVDNRNSVERTLGRPTFTSQFGEPAWYYVSVNTRQAPFTRPRTHEQTLLKITFDGAGNVAAINRAGMEQVARLDPDGDKTPTLGRDRSFFEDLFGNIGSVGAIPGAGTAAGGGSGPNGS